MKSPRYRVGSIVGGRGYRFNEQTGLWDPMANVLIFRVSWMQLDDETKEWAYMHENGIFMVKDVDIIKEFSKKAD